MPKAKKTENSEKEETKAEETVSKPGKKEKAEKTKKHKKLTQEEFEKEILKLAEKGLSSEKIGEDLRQQGIHPKEYSKSISNILKDKNKYVNPDLKNIEIKLEQLKVHCGKNKQDKRAIREKERVASQLRRMRIHFNVPLPEK